MDEREEQQIISRRRSGRVWAGLFLLLIGGVLLLDQMNFPLPDWLFNWHILLVAIGLFIGLRHNFRGGVWFILMAIGGFLIIQDYYPETHLHRFLWPAIFMAVGILFILRPHRYRGSHFRLPPGFRGRYEHYGPGPGGPGNPGDPANPSDPGNSGGDPGNTGGTGGTGGPGNTGGPGDPGDFSHLDQKWREKFERHRMKWERRHRYYMPNTAFGRQREGYSPEDFIDATSILGGVHKKVMSKNFKGGDITTFMGGTEIDLTQADFTGTVRLDVTQIMGGTKIIVPPHWEIRSEVTAIFAGFEDKRTQPAVTNSDKVLVIDGTSIFGGIELNNY
ncbi:LiaF transmembrane domain-containing protein [Puia dinghuensis]|uniref:Cell wall-active antibiotics response LiaF-like C-terminal domain-containing protein n=1 Tax=Puia dinghuensis TaxID=1792502 RepID=A0A8J2UJ50_9BACT|nr:LiaF domain-containing protein [Puia dinghuensis]GGB25261.1 hypothetical protein GCM10011511_56530 [Puia dinghuensis]